MQLAVSLRLIAPAEPLIAVLESFGERYQPAVSNAILWRLGVCPRDPETDRALVQAIEQALQREGSSIDRFFFDGFGGRLPADYGEAFDEVRAILAPYDSRRERDHVYWRRTEPCSMLIDEVEAIWSAIDQHEDWSVFAGKVAAIREMGAALA
jgi:uncharacterized protein YdiU (UPF0061 family)